ncbi:hypothetical protein AB0J68_00130 [Micromonospora sp. NPDC049580]|uniref:hypothetical protein n=1 Tax=Micromonospora sp. NPDC049580 TaxID=3154832 RepID=UPI003449DF1C
MNSDTTVKVNSDTTVNWFSIDIAGNVESNYKPDGQGSNYNKQRVGRPIAQFTA